MVEIREEIDYACKILEDKVQKVVEGATLFISAEFCTCCREVRARQMK